MSAKELEALIAEKKADAREVRNPRKRRTTVDEEIEDEFVEIENDREEDEDFLEEDEED